MFRCPAVSQRLVFYSYLPILALTLLLSPFCNDSWPLGERGHDTYILFRSDNSKISYSVTMASWCINYYLIQMKASLMRLRDSLIHGFQSSVLGRFCEEILGADRFECKSQNSCAGRSSPAPR